MSKNIQEKLKFSENLIFSFELDNKKFYRCQKKGKFWYWYYRVKGCNKLYYLGARLVDSLSQQDLFNDNSVATINH